MTFAFSSLFVVQTGHDVAGSGGPEGTVQLHLPQSGERHHEQVREDMYEGRGGRSSGGRDSMPHAI